MRGSTVPRLFTPPLVSGKSGPCGCGCALTPETSAGFSVAEFARDVLGVTLHRWQRWLLIHALELRPDGRFRFRNVVVLVARQNGKSTLSVVLALWFMYVYAARVVLGTAQDLDTAEEIWEKALDFITETDEDDEPVRPDLLALLDKVTRVNGKKQFQLATGERYKVKAASRRAGRGLTGDLILLDELREHQTWDAWGAITKTAMARPDAQVWCLSNAGDVTSVVLSYLRLKAHEAIGDPDGLVAAQRVRLERMVVVDDDEAMEAEAEVEVDDLSVDDLFLAEWSAAPGCALEDVEQIAMANPSLGYSIELRTILSAARTDPEWVYRTEVLCQWPEGALAGPFPAGAWEAGLNELVETPMGPELAPGDRIDRSQPIVACVAVSVDRSHGYIALSGRRADGQLQTEIAAAKRGTGWMREWLVERRSFIRAVTGQSRGTNESEFVAEWADDKTFPIPVVPLGGLDLTAAHGKVLDLVTENGVRHNPQKVLDVPAALAATKKLGGDGFVIDRHASECDAAPLAAFIGATWLALQPAPKQRTRAVPSVPQIAHVSPGGVMTAGF